VITLVFVIPALKRWIFPVRNVPSIRIDFGSSGKAEICATLTNVSKNTITITECNASCVYSRRTVVFRYLRNPLIKRGFYRALKYAGPSFALLGLDPETLLPSQQIKLRHAVRIGQPMYCFLTPEIVVDVKLSNGRKLSSGRLEIPERWRFK